MEYAIPKGVFDILPHEANAEDKWKESGLWEYLEQVMRKTAHDYGFHEIRTPIFERTELFTRSAGEGSDIVTKEMYTFLDRGERSMTLRPEGTASAMRAFLEHRLYNQPGIHKYFYIGPMFRYERQQAGRYRQHHQFGAEAIGNGTPEQDAEIIDFLCELYRRLGLQHIEVQINSIGDAPSRAAYRDALAAFLRPQLGELSAESKVRFEKNILRILDSKDLGDQNLLNNAPTILDFLSPESKTHFERVLFLLDSLKIPYRVNTKLVRGLDYYTKTVFEITSGALGAHNSLVGGGRYDGLTSLLGGPDLPSIGFATGMERILQTMLKQGAHFPPAPHPTLFIIPLGEGATQYCFHLLSTLRHNQIAAEIDLSGKKVQQCLQTANHLRADYCMIIGEDELAHKKGTLKIMATRENIDVPLENLCQKLQELISLSRKAHV
jgi:histidyl-tRNA synthetase